MITNMRSYDSDKTDLVVSPSALLLVLDGVHVLNDHAAVPSSVAAAVNNHHHYQCHITIITPCK